MQKNLKQKEKKITKNKYVPDCSREDATGAP